MNITRHGSRSNHYVHELSNSEAEGGGEVRGESEGGGEVRGRGRLREEER